MRAIVMKRFGDADVLRLGDVPDPEPRDGYHVVDVTLCGVNFADVHVRQNTYLTGIELPCTPGNEVVGRVDGRRVVALTPGGGYAEKTLVPQRTTWDVPDDISDEHALVLALQGNSAWHALFTAGELAPGQTVLIPAAAGGFGSLAVQMAHQAGARVIAMAGTEDKRSLAEELGADAVVDSSSCDALTERIVKAAGGPVHIALETGGGETFDQVLGAVAPGGRVVVYGQACGQDAAVSTRALIQKSITVAGFWLASQYADPTALSVSMAGLFGAVRSGLLRPVTGTTYPLGEAPQAHRDLQARRHSGKLALDTSS
ncbi:zinc-binding dehydrogenase [Streptomyces sp. NPDC048636]|uniref:quinone oxidoreductase family protein n=1 Tax=Streptomyces sp. NPDC048636 TaxID=3155762 RepID=UPI00343F3615